MWASAIPSNLNPEDSTPNSHTQIDPAKLGCESCNALQQATTHRAAARPMTFPPARHSNYPRVRARFQSLNYVPYVARPRTAAGHEVHRGAMPPVCTTPVCTRLSPSLSMLLFLSLSLIRSLSLSLSLSLSRARAFAHSLSRSLSLSLFCSLSLCFKFSLALACLIFLCHPTFYSWFHLPSPFLSLSLSVFLLLCPLSLSRSALDTLARTTNAQICTRAQCCSRTHCIHKNHLKPATMNARVHTSHRRRQREIALALCHSVFLLHLKSICKQSRDFRNWATNQSEILNFARQATSSPLKSP